MSNECYIGLGSNLAEPIEQLSAAIKALAKVPSVHNISLSSFYKSRPMGPQDQPDYVNAVVRFDCDLAPIELLDQLQKIEQEQGRVRKKEQWGPRTLDLDILLYSQQQVDLPRLMIPHYGMKEREFVLYPLHELAPSLTLPDGTPLAELIKTVPLNGLQKI